MQESSQQIAEKVQQRVVTQSGLIVSLSIVASLCLQCVCGITLPTGSLKLVGQMYTGNYVDFLVFEAYVYEAYT